MKTYSLLIFSSLLLFSACKKNDDNDSSGGSNNTGGSTALTIDSHWQVKAKIGGTDYSKVDGSGAAGVGTGADPGPRR